MTTIDWQQRLGWSDGALLEVRALGYSFLKQGHYARSKTYFEALIALDPSNAYDRQTLGALHLQLGEYDEALIWLDQAIALEPTHLPTQINRAKTLFLLGMHGEAMTLAIRLSRTADPRIQSLAQALLMAYS